MTQVSIENLASIRQAHRDESLVLVHGVFDVLHTGHLEHLEVAKSLGSIVAVALWSDAHVASRKGPARPINNIQDRMRLIDGLKPVDYVFEVPDPVFTEETMVPVVAAIQPDLYLLSAKNPTFGGAPFVTHESGRVTSVVHDLTYLRKANSTTGIVDRIRSNA